MIELLDCTLRDGGYVNNWEFDTATAQGVIDRLYQSGVRWVEIGIMGKGAQVGKQTKFSSFEEMRPLLLKRKPDCHYAVMVTTSASENFEYPVCTEMTPDVIRVAYFKPELEKTLELVKKLKELGYLVFMQAMASFMYSEVEMQEMLRQVNQVKPYAFYMVDSFSTMYPADVKEMERSILNCLDESILFGFHAHNNIQMAFANVQEFMREVGERKVFVDGSVYGMGRGAGNVPTELLMTWLNDNFGGRYEISPVLKVYEQYLEKIYKEYGWGYTLPYYLTAVNALNSAWGWFFMSRGIDDLEGLSEAFLQIPKEWNYTLNVEIGNRILETMAQKRGVVVE